MPTPSTPPQLHQALFASIEQLVMLHSPSGVEGEIDRALLARFAALGYQPTQDAAGNIVVKIAGRRDDAVAITAHKDEIGGIVKRVMPEGRLQVRALGGSFPWVYGEGVVDLLGDAAVIQGVLSFGSRHVSHESPQKNKESERALLWQDAWVETKLSDAQLAAAGIRAGSRMVVGKHRKRPIRLQDHIASYTLDNKASLAILLQLAERLRGAVPGPTIYLVASAKEEIGAVGALYFTQKNALDAMIALEICPVAPEYPIKEGDEPVLMSQDGACVYDESLNAQLRRRAQQCNIPLQDAAVAGFGSDASIAAKFGHVARAACLGFPTQNTHGFEIAHLGAIQRCIDVLFAYCTALDPQP